tara:strand:+ start:266 stop:667 length:402 start_codon:yes stop_codon:yes gene_type:complete
MNKQIDFTNIQGSQIPCAFQDYYQEYEQVGFLLKGDAGGYRAEGCSSLWFDRCRIYYHPKLWISYEAHTILPDGLMVNVTLSPQYSDSIHRAYDCFTEDGIIFQKCKSTGEIHSFHDRIISFQVPRVRGGYKW